MERLTEKELELMKLFWASGDAFVRELVDRYPSPKPHFNTVSTYVRLLEKKGLVKHEELGNNFRYSPAVSAEEYSVALVKEIAEKFYGNSMKDLIVSLLGNVELSEDDMWDLMTEMRRSRKRE